jgi:hypothetical protein
MKRYLDENIRRFCNEAESGADGADAGGDAAGGDTGADAQTLANQAVPPESVLLFDEHGRTLGNGRVGTGEGGDGVILANASVALATAPIQRLTTYVNGLPMQPVEQLANFLAPRVDAGLVFDYEVLDQDNQFAKIEDDVVGLNGLPGVVHWDPDSTTQKQLQFRGVETPYDHSAQQLDASVPGRSVAAGEQKRVRRLRGAIERGRLARIVSLISATGSSSTIDFSSDNDPISAIQDEVHSLLETCPVPRQWVRILFGSSGWKTLTQHVYLTGGGNFARQMITKQQIANHLELPVENIEISYVQAASSLQGKTSSKAVMIGGTTVLFFICAPNPQDDGDASFAKTFSMKLNGQYMYAYRNVTHAALNVYNVGLAYYENTAITYTNGLVRRTVSTT